LRMSIPLYRPPQSKVAWNGDCGNCDPITVQ